MKLSKTSDNIPIESHRGFLFIKNTADQREAQPITNLDEAREMGISIVVVAHIGQAKTTLLEILQNHDYTGEIILVGNDAGHDSGYVGPKSIEEQVIEMANNPIIINITPMMDDNDIHLVPSIPPYKNFKNNYVPKVQKNKVIPRRKKNQKNK